ncbi:MAG: toll-Interleukin receptor [Planctomycetes bacterium]|nr:toll-Interleukin receptor [Planctomycetota bacterium]
MSREDDIKKLISDHNRRLQKLKEQQARFGWNTPPEILNEIEAIEAKLEQLQTELEEPESVGKSSPPTITIGRGKRLQQQITELQRQWDVFSEIISHLRQAMALESRPDEKLRLEHNIAEAETDRQKTDGRLSELETELQQLLAEGFIISEDGDIIADDETPRPPLPEFNPHLPKTLEVPKGVVKLRDRFYVERDEDRLFEHEMVKSGATVIIRGPRQTGKTSLLIRGLRYAQQNGAKTVHLQLQRLSSHSLTSYDIFLRQLAMWIFRELGLDLAIVEKSWTGLLEPSLKLTYLIEDEILSKFNPPVILAMDEADRLVPSPFHKDFFGLVRSWHESRPSREQWGKLNIVLAISTEPYLLIDDVYQSPFNVGKTLELGDFDPAQVRDLNRRHGSPVAEADFGRLMAWLNGHPYLTRQALYTLVTERLAWTDLTHIAATDQGPFGDHLRRLRWLLRDEPGLRKALKEVISHNRCSDKIALFRLLRAGLVKGRGEVYECRCDLYRIYFEGIL